MDAIETDKAAQRRLFVSNCKPKLYIWGNCRRILKKIHPVFISGVLLGHNR